MSCLTQSHQVTARPSPIPTPQDYQGNAKEIHLAVLAIQHLTVFLVWKDFQFLVEASNTYGVFSSLLS